MNQEYYTERLPVVRVTPSLKERLERIAAGGVSPRLADHIRYAVEQYVTAAEAETAAAPQPSLRS